MCELLPSLAEGMKEIMTDANHGSLKSQRCAKSSRYLSHSASLCRACLRNYRKMQAGCVYGEEIINRQVLKNPPAF